MATESTAKATREEKKLKAFRELLNNTNKMKQFADEEDGGKIISLLSDRPRDVETITTGSITLDSILGGGKHRPRQVA